MAIFLFLNLIALVLVLATLPLLVELLVLTLAALLPGARQRAAEAGSELPALSILIPAHNEETLIGRCVRGLVGSSGLSGTEILVVAHNCTDSTAAEARSAGARVLELNDPSQRGKGCALSYGFDQFLAGTSQAVMVIDADSVVDAGLIEAVRQKFRGGTLALQCRYEVLNSADNQRTRLMALAFYAFNVIRPRGRARLGLSAGILGNGFALHRDVLTRIPYNAHSVVEDLEYHLALVRGGVRVEFVDTAAVRGEMPVSAKSSQSQRARWEGGRMRVAKRWAAQLMVDVLCGRWKLLELLLDLVSLPIASEVLLLLIAACLPVAWLRWYALGGLIVLAGHVASAAAGAPGFWGTMRALATAPVYIFWKLRIFPDIWRASRANAAWVRTERESPADGR